MLVYVKGIDGRKLMPCKPAKARKLLRDGKAKAIKRVPFTIQLLFECENQVQDITVGIDKGAKTTGFACVGNGQLLMSGEIQHRTDIKKKMEGRRGNRRTRRSRKWYRESRFSNRASSKRSGRLPPSIKANADEVVRVIRKIPLPITSVVVEDVQVDIARLNDPTLQGKDYQKSNKLDENLRMATLMRDDFQCQYCKKEGVKLHAHHIIWREHGGKNSIYNLVTLCENCHSKVHAGEVTIAGGVSGFKDRIAQRTMQGKTHLYSNLKSSYDFSTVFGYQTAEYRKSLGLPKDHDIDALCVATLQDGEVIEYNRDNFYSINFRARQTRRQYYDNPRKGKGRVRYQVNSELDGFQKGDLVRVRGYTKRVESIYSSGMLAFHRVKGEPNASVPSSCTLVEKSSTMEWNIIQ